MGLFRRKPTTLPVSVVGVLLHPQNVQFWDESWVLINALGASGIPASVNGDAGSWTYGASPEVQQSGDTYQTTLTSPSGVLWTARWSKLADGSVRYVFDPHEPDHVGIVTDAEQLSRCCRQRGGLL